MSEGISMHAARTALNRDPALRQWAEAWLKSRERGARPEMMEEEFERHWRDVRPERMHWGAVEAVVAHRQQNPQL